MIKKKVLGLMGQVYHNDTSEGVMFIYNSTFKFEILNN